MKNKQVNLVKAILFAVVPLLITSTGYAQYTGTIKGKIIDKATKQAVTGASVAIKTLKTGTLSDTSGLFKLSNIQEGIYSVVVSFIGYQEKTVNDIHMIRNKTIYLEIEIEESQQVLQQVQVSSFKYENSPITPVSDYSFSREEISRNPGAQGDIFRAIGMLPGVSSSGGQYSAIAVRGQGVRDNIYMVDDIPVTELGHLEGNGSFNDPNGGRFSIFAPRVIDQAQFQGGGISAQYGRRSASCLNLGIKEGNKEDFTVDGQLDLLGLTLNYDGPSYVHKKTSLFVSARYQDFTRLLSMLNLKDIGIPRYADFILKSTTELGTKNKLSVLAVVSPDEFIKDIENVKLQKVLTDPSLINAGSNKNIFGLSLRTLTSKNSYWKNIMYYTRTSSKVNIGASFPLSDNEGKIIEPELIKTENNVRVINYTETKYGYRTIYTINFENRSKLVSGIDIDMLNLKNYRHLSRFDTMYIYDFNDSRNPNQFYALIDPVYFNADFNQTAFNTSAYTDYSFTVFKKLNINSGIRYDYTGFTRQHTLSPRLSGNWQLNHTSSINFAGGLYYQDPVYSEIADQPSDKKLKQQQVIQVVLGYKKYFTPDLKITVEGWYKKFDHLVVRPMTGQSEQTNKGTGWAHGIDINLTKRLTRKLHGQIGYSYMQSKRNDHDGSGEYDFTFSQPHQVNFLISYKASKHWILASKFRYATGKPTDTYIVHANIFNNPSYLRYSQEITAKNANRLDDFISLDIRADYSIQMKQINVILFIDIVNILNRQNENSRTLNPYTGELITDGLAIFPTFGLKFEF